jgi:hypothetical protein
LHGERVADRINRIVRDRKAGDIELADREATASLKSLNRGLKPVPVDRRNGAMCQVDRNLQMTR